MGLTEAIVAIIVALLSGGTIRSVFLYLKERKAKTPKRITLGTDDLEVSAAAVVAMQKQIEAMSVAWDEERESYQARDHMRRERIEELEAELDLARERLAVAQSALIEVSRQVESLTLRLASLANEVAPED